MEVKLIDLLNSRESLAALNAIPFKALYGFKVKKILKAVNDELAIFEELLKEKREEIQKDGEPTPEQIEAFEKEMQAATAVPVELDISNVNLSWFARTNGAITDDTEWHDFTPAHFQMLSWLIVDDIG